MLKCVALPRIQQVQGSSFVKMYGGWKLGPKHAIWDLKQISTILELFLNDESLSSMPWVAEKLPHDLKKIIDNLLTEMQAC